MNKKHVLLLLVCLSIIFVLTGCSGKVQVKGKVVFPDGTPLTIGTVNFCGDMIEARGSLDKNGNYVIGSSRTGDGLPKGTYRVAITQATTLKEVNENKFVSVVLVDNKFNDPDTSELTVNVDRRMTYDITVQPPQDTKKK